MHLLPCWNGYRRTLMSSVEHDLFRIILRDIHEQKFFHDNLTQPKSTKNVDSSGIWTRTFGRPVRPLYLLSYRVHRVRDEFLSNLSGREYPEGASSNPARANIFQLTSTVSDYHEKISVRSMTWKYAFKTHHRNLSVLLSIFPQKKKETNNCSRVPPTLVHLERD